jgi:L-2-hydroxycarboxylate dehydrogenase (NAD+)
MRADLFIPAEDYRARMDTLMQRVRACPKAEGVSEILIPGEPEVRYEQERRRTGIPYSGSEIAVLQEEAGKAGVAPLAVSQRPLGG